MAATAWTAIVTAGDAMTRALAAGHTMLVFGNGGSAADAQHFVAELVGRYERDRAGRAAVALTTDTSILTAVGNDFGFEQVFARQVEALGRPGDLALAITTSGDSPNVVRALEASDGARAGDDRAHGPGRRRRPARLAAMSRERARKTDGAGAGSAHHGAARACAS